MQYRGRKLLGLLMAMLMIVSLLPAAALATEGEVAPAVVTDEVDTATPVVEGEDTGDDTATPDEGENTGDDTATPVVEGEDTGDDTATPDEGENTGDDTTTTAVIDPTTPATVALEGAETVATGHTDDCVAEVIHSETESTDAGHYNSLSEALNAAHAGDTVKLLKDVTIDTALSFVSVTLDLNGKTLTVKKIGNAIKANTTIKNGNVVIATNETSGEGVFDINSNTRLTLDGVNVSGDDYKTPYGVFRLYQNSVLEVLGGVWNLKGDKCPTGGVFKSGSETGAKVVIRNATMTFDDVQRVSTELDTEIKNSNISISNLEHGFNRGALTVKDSTVTMTGITGRGITVQKGDVSITGSTVEIKTTGAEPGILFKGNKSFTADNSSTLDADSVAKESTVESAAINGKQVTDEFIESNGKADLPALLVSGGNTTISNTANTVFKVAAYTFKSLTAEGGKDRHNIPGIQFDVYTEWQCMTSIATITAGSDGIARLNADALGDKKPENGKSIDLWILQTTAENAEDHGARNMSDQPLKVKCEVNGNGIVAFTVETPLANGWEKQNDVYCVYNECYISMSFDIEKKVTVKNKGMQPGKNTFEFLIMVDPHDSGEPTLSFTPEGGAETTPRAESLGVENTELLYTVSLTVDGEGTAKGTVTIEGWESVLSECDVEVYEKGTAPADWDYADYMYLLTRPTNEAEEPLLYDGMMMVCGSFPQVETPADAGDTKPGNATNEAYCGYDGKWYAMDGEAEDKVVFENIYTKAAPVTPSPAPTATPAPTAAPTATPAPSAKPAHSPKTGDEANLALWLVLASVSVLGLGYVCVKKKEN